MYELFLTAPVRKDDFEMACAILQGLTCMQARQNVYRTLYYAGQPQPRGLPNQRTFRQSGQALPLWKELSNHLKRSSYVLQLAYEVFPESDFGSGATVDLNGMPGTLRWTDLPDPLRDTPVTQRKKIDIPDQRNLLTTMSDNGHTFKNELIHETFSYVRTNVEFVFSRTYQLPESPGRPTTALPAWSDLRPVDPAQKWILNVKLTVEEENQPEKLQKANKELMAVKEELDRLFEFKVVDRRVLDTRIAPPQVLPPR